MNHPAVHTLCALRPFFAVSKLLVTPVVAVLTDPSVLCSLTPCESEVDVIFDHPLEALLDPTLSAQERLVEIKSELWPAEEEYHVCASPTYFCGNPLMLFILELH